jgi:type IV fimbrial biogenesis protein FimT
MKTGTGRAMGFTLLELMVTVSLMAFMGLLAATSFDTGSWLAHQRLKGAARELSTNLQKARMNAIKQNTRWAITFNAANNTYTLVSAGPDNDIDTAADNVTDVTASLPASGNGVVFGFGRANKDINGDALPGGPVTFTGSRVVFTPRGLATAAGTCYLTNDHQDPMAVVVRLNGSIDIRRWNGSTFE